MTDKTYCEPDDPGRCQGMTHDGQCNQLSLSYSKFCKRHARGDKTEEMNVERYLIDNQELRDSYMRQQGNKHYLNLEQEIHLIKMLIERRLNSIRTEADLTLSCAPIANLVARLESMKVALLKMEQQLGLVINKDDLNQLAREIAAVLDEELEGKDDKEELMERICIRVVEAIQSAGTQESGENNG
jgi:hypothetical protein